MIVIRLIQEIAGNCHKEYIGIKRFNCKTLFTNLHFKQQNFKIQVKIRSLDLVKS